MGAAVNLDAPKAAALVFVASIVQVSILSGAQILGSTPDLLLVVLVMVALLRGSVFGAAAGFGAGLLVDTATLGTLGQTSLLLTLLGYWVGRYGETTGRDRTHAPWLSVTIVTVVYALGALVFHVLLDEAVSARVVLVDTLFPGILLNLVLTWPVYAVVRRLLPPEQRADRRPSEVSALG